MCAARPGPLFFMLFPLLTRGSIINPTLKTACRDRARFRRDFRPVKIPTRLHFSIHIHFSLYFLVWFYPASSFPCLFRLHRAFFLFSYFPRNLYTNVKLTIHPHLFSPECRVVPSVIQRFDARVQRILYPFIRRESISQLILLLRQSD